MTVGAGLFILVLIVAIATFLVWKAIPALRVAGFHFFSEKAWFPDAQPAKFGVAAIAFGTVLSSVVALILVVPVAIGAALTLTELAPAGWAPWAATWSTCSPPSQAWSMASGACTSSCLG